MYKVMKLHLLLSASPGNASREATPSINEDSCIDADWSDSRPLCPASQTRREVSTDDLVVDVEEDKVSGVLFLHFLGSLTKVNVISLLYTFTSAEFGPFSAVSTPIFGRKYSFFSIFEIYSRP